MKKILLLGIMIMILFLIMPFSTINSQTTVPVKTPGVFVAETSSNAHGSLDPATDYETVGFRLIQETYEGLLRYNGNSLTTFAPSLAYANYTISPDGLSYTFYLRNDVKFSNGDPFNAYVMQYSIQRAIIMNDPASGVWIPDSVIRDGSSLLNLADANVAEANSFLANASVVAVSDYVLTIHLGVASSAFIPSMIFTASYAVDPLTVIANRPTSYTTDPTDNQTGMVSLVNMFPQLPDNATIRTKLGLSAGANVAISGIVPSSPVGSPINDYVWNGLNQPGTGPYMLTSDTAGVVTTLTKNVNWWNKVNFNTNAPDTVQIKQVSEVTTRILDLENGNTMSIQIPDTNLDQVVDTKTFTPLFNNINVYMAPSLIEGFLGFNQNATLDSTQVLQNSWTPSNQYNASYIASNHLVQYSWNNATGGEQLASPGNPFSSLLFRRAFAYAFNYNSYIMNVTNNKDFRMQGVIPKGLLGHQDDLISKGYIPTQDLVFAKSLFQAVSWQGFITIHYNTGNVARQLLAQIIKNTFASLNVGITILLQEDSWAQYLQINYGGQAAIFNFAWAPDYADANDYIVPILHTGGIYPVWLRYSNPYVDSLIDQAGATTNNTLRNQLYRQMEINTSQDYPYIYLNQVNNVYVFSKWVTGADSPSSGVLNALGWSNDGLGSNYQYIGLEPYTIYSTPTTTPTSSPYTSSYSQPISYTTTPSLSSSSSVQVSTSLSSKSSDSGGDSSQPTISTTAPGFGALILVGSLTISVFFLIRKRKN